MEIDYFNMNYSQCLDIYKNLGKLTDTSELRSEAFVESLKDWSELYTIDDIKNWFVQRRMNCKMNVDRISLEQCRRWKIESGMIHHDSGDFFVVEGIRVTNSDREVDSWDQPIITQVGFDGGILGLIRKRIDGIPYYLVDAKEEPGNYGIVQLSPTLQSTYANLRKSHGGAGHELANIFESELGTVLYKRWVAEDGGRLYNKRNKAILIETDCACSISVKDNYRWMTLWQIKECMKENAWVNHHLRTLVAHL